MAGKHTFQSRTFRSWTFASNCWAGVGVEIVAALPVRYHTLIGPALTSYELIGPNAGYTVFVGPSLRPHVLEG